MRFFKIFGVISLFVFLLVSCSKKNDIGMIIRPGSDDVKVVCDSFVVNSSTIFRRDLYSETDKPLLGCYKDPIYGEYKIDFISEFRYIRNFIFPESSVLDSVELVMYYKSFFGDSSRVHEATVYKIDKKRLSFTENYKANIDIEEFCSKSEVLGSQTYTAYDRTISDSIHSLDGFCNSVRIKLPVSLGNEMITNTDLYKTQDAFSDWLHGVYVTNTYGSQTILYIDSVNIELSYHYTPDSAKPDSTISLRNVFPSNKEVTEFVHVDVISEPDVAKYADTIDILSMPVGALPKITIPFDRIYNNVCGGVYKDELHINHASLVVDKAFVEEEYGGRIDPTTYYVLVREADMDYFFTQSLYPAPDASTALAMFSDSTYYICANIGDYMENVLKNKEYISNNFSTLNDYVIVPISGATDIAGSNAVIRPSFKPSGVRVCSSRSKKSPMRIILTYTEL